MLAALSGISFPQKIVKYLLVAIICVAPCALAERTDDVAELEARVEDLAQQLQVAKAALTEAREAARVAESRLAATAASSASDIRLGPLTIGGAVRVNYIRGDYNVSGDGPQRGGNGGNVELDTLRVNASLERGNIVGKFEYRWYTDYNFLHTAWIGYDFDRDGQVQVGVTRVPFGPGPYGVSQSWFFDQHYYVGLADDMDLGVKYVTSRANWNLALAYFASSEGKWNGASEDSARYGYDFVRWRSAILHDGSVVEAPANGYEERNQFNLRAIYHFGESADSDLGFSLQIGDLRGRQTDDGDHWAASAHMVNRIGHWTLASQITRYEIHIDDDNRLQTDELIPMGAYDFAWPVATAAWLPAISLSHKFATPSLPWLDYVLPYIEYSGILKDSGAARDSEMIILGAAWSSGGWYIYTDYAHSNGNLFVGNRGDDYSNVLDGVGDFGAAGNNRWNYRFNVNFGYYF